MNPALKAVSPTNKLLAGLGVALMAFVAWDQSYFWSTVDEYSFGWLVPIFVGFVIYDRLPQITYYLTGDATGLRKVPRVSYLEGGKTAGMRTMDGLVYTGLFAALICFCIGGLLRGTWGTSNAATFYLSGSLSGLVLALAWLIGERDTQGRFLSVRSRLAFAFIFLFPALIWLISAPLDAGLLLSIRTRLMEKVTIVVFWAFDVFGTPLIREGNILILGPGNHVGVADACSGIRSLTACIFAGSFLAAVFLDRFWKKAILMASAVLLAIFTNLLRSLFLTYWAYTHGSEALDEHFSLLGVETNVHDLTGYLVLGITCLLLLLMLPIFNYKLPEPHPPADDDEGNVALNREASSS